MVSEYGLRALSVTLQNKRVGIINRLGGDRNIFSFEQDYIDDAQRPTLSLSFKALDGGVATSTRSTATRVPPFFSNLLPEGHLRRYLAERAGVRSTREFFLLAALGADLPGALEVTPFHNEDSDLRSRMVEPARDTDDAKRHGPALRFSLAGVQLKFSAVLESSGGLTIPADGMGGAWIVKLPSTRFSAVPENEFVMLELARSIGIEVPPIRLVALSEIRGIPVEVGSLDGPCLAVERFDRSATGERIHMEDFAQVFGVWPENKYERRSYANIAAVLWAEADEASTFEFVRRVAFSVLIGNADMHLKNWSVLYPDGRTPVLSPAYDFVATLPYLPNDSLALSFGKSKGLSAISMAQIRRFVDAARLPSRPIAEVVRETAALTVEAWKTLSPKSLLSASTQTKIGLQIERVASSVR